MPSMPPKPLSIRPLSPADLPGMLHLSAQAGWNQLPADWQRLLSLWPGQCLAGCVGQQLVATASLATYGQRLGWVGMILVEQSCRGQGIGGQMVQAILNLGDTLRIPCLGLDATDLGQPVYARCGFQTVSLIDRWTGSISASLRAVSPSPHASDASGSREMADRVRGEGASPIDWPPIASLDLSETALPRLPLLQTLAAEPHAILRTIHAAGNLLAFGLARPGRLAAHIGPIIATDNSAAADLFDDLLHQIVARTGLGTVFIDLPRHSALAGHLERRGFSISRRLARMLRPAGQELRQTSRVLAIPGFELG